MTLWQRFKYGPLQWLPFGAWKLFCRSTWRACDYCGRRGRFKRAACFGGGKPARFYCDSECSCADPEGMQF